LIPPLLDSHVDRSLLGLHADRSLLGQHADRLLSHPRSITLWPSPSAMSEANREKG